MISSSSNIYRYKESIISNFHLPKYYILWLDNYAKFYKNSSININTSGFTSANWTALGCIEIKHNFNITKSFNYHSIFNNDITTIVNNNIFKYRIGLKQYRNFCVANNAFIFTFPLKDPNKQSNLYYNLQDFYPIKILSENISSDNGFFNCFKEILDKYCLLESITPLVVDINIYWRYSKWIYNPNNNCSQLSNHIIPILGFWHNYKQLCNCIWKYGIKYLFGPLFHSLWPSSSILLKPKLGHMEIFFTYLTHVYDETLQEDLDTFISLSKKDSKKRNILKNIKFLLNSAIPFVFFIFISFSF
jgi:hypothetical protein